MENIQNVVKEIKDQIISDLEYSIDSRNLLLEYVIKDVLTEVNIRNIAFNDFFNALLREVGCTGCYTYIKAFEAYMEDMESYRDSL